jgi:hypothetical protein
VKRHERCSISGRRKSPMKYHYFHRFFTDSVKWRAMSPIKRSSSRFLNQVFEVWGMDSLRSSGEGWQRLTPPRRVVSHIQFLTRHDPLRGQCQAGSLTGAVHLSKGNAGVLRLAQRGQKPRVEQKGKCWLDPDFQYEYGPRKRGLSILLSCLEF